MMSRPLIKLTVMVAIGLGFMPVFAQSMGTGFTYQGQLKQQGVPVDVPVDLEFALWDAEVGGSDLNDAIALNDVQVSNGLFTVELDFETDIYAPVALWLEIKARVPAGAGEFITLTPRQRLAPVPFALALPGLQTRQNATSPNVIGGWDQNNVTTGVVGATLSGGGAPEIGGNPRPNVVTDDYGTISGGSGNRSGDNDATLDDADHATIGGGYANLASASVSTVGGGWYNRATGDRATIPGGWNNLASMRAATVGGGRDNQATGTSSTVPGGHGNVAAGDYSFAAGWLARANHNGAFVWADSINVAFESTAADQFLIRAAGGVGIGTASPSEQLTVNGIVESLSGGFKFPDGTVQETAGGGGDSVWDLNGATAYYNGGSVGIGTATLDDLLEVSGGLLSLDTGAGGALTGIRIRENNDMRWTLLYRTWQDDDLEIYDEVRHQAAMIFKSGTGDIGIGTATPAARLDVVGTVRMSGLQMTSAPTAGHVLTADSNGVASWQPPGEFTLPFDGSASSSSPVLSITNSGAGTGVYGLGGSYGVHGLGGSYGVYGQSGNTGGSGVMGFAASSSGNSMGGQFSSNSTTGRGVYGWMTVPSGENYGGLFENASPQGYAIYGKNFNKNTFGYVGGPGYGVYGEHDNTGSYGVLGGNGFGVSGLDGNSYSYGYLGYDSCGVWGLGFQGGTGVYGESGSGYGVHGRASGSTAKGVYGESTYDGYSDEAVGVYGINVPSGSHGKLGGPYWGVYGEASGYGVWGLSVTGKGIYGYSEPGDGVYGVASSGNGVHGYTQTGAGVYAEASNQAGVGLHAVGVGGGYAAVFDGAIQITGGSDLSEQFDVRSSCEDLSPSPGMVVSIDPEKPGDLVVSTKAYDRKVAGILSGAGGINPGMLMGQKGSTADGARAVALTGRVYCWADASGGPIEPGDLLTTSDTPGHTMKVSNYTKAQGAIIGKAMTSLEEGRGLVLVLVNLQ